MNPASFRMTPQKRAHRRPPASGKSLIFQPTNNRSRPELRCRTAADNPLPCRRVWDTVVRRVIRCSAAMQKHRCRHPPLRFVGGRAGSGPIEIRAGAVAAQHRRCAAHEDTRIESFRYRFTLIQARFTLRQAAAPQRRSRWNCNSLLVCSDRAGGDCGLEATELAGIRGALGAKRDLAQTAHRGTAGNHMQATRFRRNAGQPTCKAIR